MHLYVYQATTTSFMACVLQSLSLAAMRDPNDEEARLLQQPGSEEQRPPPLQWLFDLEMAMGCDLVCEHFREEDEAVSA